MTLHEIRVLEDGTRVYSNYTRYKPKSDKERKYNRNKPDDPRAVLYNSLWFLPLEFLPTEVREFPETRPDTDAFDHAWKPRRCKCYVCKRPEARRWRRKGLKALRDAQL